MAKTGGDLTTMDSESHSRHTVLDESIALRMILEGTASETGEPFFDALVKSLAKALDTYGAWVTEYLPEGRILRALAFWAGDALIPEWQMVIDGTPCERVIETARLVHFPENIGALYPDDPDIQTIDAVSYMGAPLIDGNGRVLGHLAVIDRKPMPHEPRLHAVFMIFAARASAELQRINAEKARTEQAEQLQRIVDGAMDAIVELDEGLMITLVNPAAQRLFGLGEERLEGECIDRFLRQDMHARLRAVIRQLETRPDGDQKLWIAGGLQALSSSGAEIGVEASIARFTMARRRYYALIMRDVNDRLEAERLKREAAYLREEIRELRDDREIIGRSKALVNVLSDIDQVAGTDATVLIMGETGTGKELVAGAIHAASNRSKRPLIRVNCAAIPAALIESEFFGHEKGAFTGATSKRDGRFKLADGGTIFLDEIGELPIELQAKLLRVLQHGEFEPVGSSKSVAVDVRVIAATNRDLKSAVDAGDFREDLYYRLNVFPIVLPPLRDRGDDVIVMAEAFAQRYAKKIGRELAPLTPACSNRLRAYSWPGNVRELQNVIERAVITSTNGQLNLARALPEPSGDSHDSSGNGELHETGIMTEVELRAFEKKNILKALEAASWKVAGPHGAASLLGVSPSTMTSRMKVLGIERP